MIDGGIGVSMARGGFFCWVDVSFMRYRYSMKVLSDWQWPLAKILMGFGM